MTPAMQVLMREMEGVWDRLTADLYERADAGAAAAALASRVSWRELPTGAGGEGREAVERYLAQELLAQLPADLERERRSRVLDTRRLVDETEFRFTHDRELGWLLPGVPPTGRPARVLAVSIVRIRQHRVDEYRTLWDQAGLRASLGL